VSPLVAVGLWLVFYGTRWGMLVRAATIDREMLGALGVDVSKLYTQVFAFGSWLAGLGGALAAPTVAVALGMDADVLINAFVVVVIGGLGSFAGTARSWSASCSPSGSSSFLAYRSSFPSRSWLWC
jgi:branched-chain amino acid transport system permease protein